MVRKKVSRGFTLFLLCIAVIFSSQSVASANIFPEKPVNLVVQFSAGGTTDMAMRVLAELAGKSLGQPVVVTNKTGGGGAVAYGFLANSQADGYTIGCFSAGASSTAPRMMEVNFDVKKDFDYIIRCGDYFMSIGVSNDSPFKTLEDLIEFGRKNPIMYGSSGVSSAVSFSTEVFGDLAGINLQHVPFDGGIAAVTALMGGHIQMAACAEVAEHTKNGNIRMLAVFSDERHPDFPDVPTLKELGFDVGLPFFVGIVGPKGIPEDRLLKLYDAFYQASQSDKYLELLNRIVWVPAHTPLKEFEKLVFEYDDKMGAIMKEMGLVKFEK